MRYNIQKTIRSTARIAFESSPALDPARKPEIWRFFPCQTTLARKSTGAVLGREAGKTCAYIVDVRPHDLICIREKLIGTEDHHWRYLRIGPEFVPLKLDLPNRCISKDECSAILEITDTAELDQVDYEDETLRTLFMQKHPRWLQEIIDRQILHWRNNKPDKFFNLAPVAIASREIERCVKESPYAALARFQNHLNKTQLYHCVLKCPRAAVMFATDKIPPQNREIYLIDHAKEALLFAADKLSDQELGLCASIEIFTAFRMRSQMTPERRAILIANSYLAASIEGLDGSLAELQTEIYNSIIAHPAQWRAAETLGGLPAILKDLRKLVGIGLDGAIVDALFQNANPKDRKTLADYIASSI